MKSKFHILLILLFLSCLQTDISSLFAMIDSEDEKTVSGPDLSEHESDFQPPESQRRKTDDNPEAAAEFAGDFLQIQELHVPELHEKTAQIPSGMAAPSTLEPIGELPSTSKTATAQSDDGYDSDSEDERGYFYPPVPDKKSRLCIPQDVDGEKCMVFYRGMHFIVDEASAVRGKFDKHQRSLIRRQFNPGRALYSSAAFDLAHVNSSDYYAITGISDADTQALLARAQEVQTQVAQLGEGRHDFQQLYTNQYDQFHAALEAKNPPLDKFTSSKNPQVSTSEKPLHAAKYAFGQKYLGEGVTKLDPDYDSRGKPKHPYLGKIWIILIKLTEIQDQNPYFVVYAHEKGLIKVYTHYVNNILTEREVSFPGLIPGKYVVYEKVVRVPSFACDYKMYFKEKYGMSKKSFESFKRNLTAPGGNKERAVKSIINCVINNTADQLEKLVKRECKKRHIHLVYKGPDEECLSQPIPIQIASDKKKDPKQKTLDDFWGKSKK